MPYMRKYNRYLLDPKCEVPLRSKYRFKKARSSASGCLHKNAVEQGREEGDVTGEYFCAASSSSNAYKTTARTPPDKSSKEQTLEGRIVATMNQSEAQMETEAEDQIENEAADTVESGSDSESDDDTLGNSFPGHGQHSENVNGSQRHPTDMDQPLYHGSPLTKAESILLVMGHSLRHCTSKEATESVLKLVEAHLPQGTDFPSTKYSFFKNFSMSDSKTKHFYCSACSSYIGALEKSAISVICSRCKKEHCEENLNAESCYFYTLDFESQIKDILEEKGSCLKIHAQTYDVSDITQSGAYHKLPLKPGDLTVTINTDGVPLYESSGFGMWPLLLQVNELDYNERMQRLLLAGLWFGSRKPAMNTFLLPFVQKMNSLSCEGVTWKDCTGKERTSKVFPGPCTVDSVARCEVMCMTQFNGEHGCAWCEEPGEVVNKGRGHCRIYPMRACAPSVRTHESFLKHANKAKTQPKQISCGIKGLSILTMLAFFSFSSNFVVDYMHAVCSGFVKTTTMMWLESEKCRGFRVRQCIEELSAKLISMTPTWEQSRLPRPLSEARRWKSSEWRNWLLFYSPVLLSGYLPSKNYYNWLNFVEMMHCMLAPSVSMETIGVLRTKMKKFLKEYEILYGKESTTYNAHLLIHLTDSIQQWGPLWGYSLYPFESMNGKLGKFVCGTRYAEIQIIDKFCLLSALPKLWQHVSVNQKESGISNQFWTLIKGYSLRKSYTKVGAIVLYGRGTSCSGAIHFKKMSVGHFCFCTADLDRSRRCNSFVQSGPTFGRILDIEVVCGCTAKGCACDHQAANIGVKIEVFTVRQDLLASVNDANSFTLVQAEPTGIFTMVSATSMRKCMAVKCNGETYLCSLSETMVLEAS